jgi:hypothetical protein
VSDPSRIFCCTCTIVISSYSNGGGVVDVAAELCAGALRAHEGIADAAAAIVARFMKSRRYI